MDITFSAVSSGLQQVYKSAKALLELKVETEVATRINALVGELGDVTGKFLAAHMAHVASQERTMDLENELARLKDFESEKARYVLCQVGEGAFSYALRPEHQGEEPLHSLCCQCYADNTKSILQFTRIDHRDRVLLCPRCKSEVRVPHGLPAEVISTSSGGSRRMF